MAYHSNKLKSFFGAAIALGAMTAANDAMALDRGCQNADVVRQALRDEGQFVLVTAVSPIPEQPKNIFTSNANGTLGYNIEQGTGEATGKLCVGIKYTDIKVNTDPSLSTPSWALFGANTTHDQWINQTNITINNKILMGATVLRNVNGLDTRGGFMMVAQGRAEQGIGINNIGAVTLTINNGEIHPTLALANVDKVQPNYDTFANRNAQLASLTKN